MPPWIALANHFGRDALPDLALGVAVDEERVIRVRMRIDESGREDAAAGVDRPRRRAGDAADLDDPAVAECHRSVRGGRSRPIDDAGIRDEDVEGAWLLRRGGERGAGDRRNRQADECRHARIIVPSRRGIIATESPGSVAIFRRARERRRGRSR